VVGHKLTRLDIQGLRGLSVLLVVVYHSQIGLRGGFAGVDAFFVISGFVITRSISQDSSDRIQTTTLLKNFYVRRIRRLIPALGALVIFTLIAASFLDSTTEGQSRIAWSAISSLLSLANVHYMMIDIGYFSLGSQTNPLLHTWSLSVEEQFYFIFPIAFLILFARSKVWKVNMMWIGAIAIASLSLCLILSHRTQAGVGSQQLAFYLPFTRAWEFLAGSLLALVGKTFGDQLSRRSRFTLNATGGVGLLWTALFLNEQWVFPGLVTLIPVLSTAALIHAGTNQESFLLRWAPLTWIGDRSYSWYLWHWPMIVFALHEFPRSNYAAPTAAFFSLVPAAFSYRFLEQPIRTRVGWGSIRTSYVWIIFLVLPLLGAVVVGAKSSRVEPDSNFQEAQASGFASLISCAHQEKLCFPPEGQDGVAILVGDSHAGMIAREFELASDSVGLNPGIASILGCPFVRTNVALYLYNFDASNLMTTSDCQQENSHLLAWVKENRPELILLVNNSPLYTQASGFDERFDLRVACMTGTGTQCLPASSSDERLQFFEERLTQTVDELANYAEKVVISLPMPQMFREPDQFVQSGELRGTPRSEIDRYRATLLPAYEKLLKNSRVALWDPVPYLCTNEVCPNGDAGGSWYSDNGHLGPRGASLLESPLRDLLRGLTQP
jgi:peptidoglycan/LPS O-acetylase OafA/YrhL